MEGLQFVARAGTLYRIAWTEWELGVIPEHVSLKLEGRPLASNDGFAQRIPLSLIGSRLAQRMPKTIPSGWHWSRW